jgi:hypothetical protein
LRIVRQRGRPGQEDRNRQTEEEGLRAKPHAQHFTASDGGRQKDRRAVPIPAAP